MPTIITLLKIAVLFAVILIPLIPGKKKKQGNLSKPGTLGVNTYGYLETIAGEDTRCPIQNR